MNLYNYKILYLGRHQDLLAKAAQEDQAKTNRNYQKFLDDALQKAGQKIIGFYHQLYRRGKRLSLKKLNS